MPTIAAEGILTERGVVQRAEMDIEDGLITAVRAAPAPAAGALSGVLVPGFVDLQVNGIDDVDVAAAGVSGAGDAWDRLDEMLLDQGVTAWCPTVVTAPLDSYARPLAGIAAAAARPAARRPHIAGAHLEGPFLGGAPGAHPVALLRDPDPGWLDALPPIVRLVTVAAERAGAVDAVERLVASGRVVSIGHSTATYEQSMTAFDAGATMVTHLFNGMGALHHREPGLVGAALADDRVAACLIADLVHLHPAVLRAAFRAKGPAGTVLVTDAVAFRAARVGRLEIGLVDGAPRLADGTLAGSALTMDQAIRNVVNAAGIPWEDAVAAATTTPARVLGLTDRGVIEPGRRADLVLLDRDLVIRGVWVGGERVRG
jgi:N-acetylglucosamine-6-phosphate deacetylase